MEKNINMILLDLILLEEMENIQIIIFVNFKKILQYINQNYQHIYIMEILILK